MPRISVIIPSFNCARYLREAIDSVLCQSFQDFEIVVIDDGSEDDTRRVVEQYQTDCRIRYVYQQNAGLPGARNTGVLDARGEFIAALDADDRLDPMALESMLAALENSGASWCLIDIVKFWDDYREIRETVLPEGDLLLGILHGDFIRRAMFFRKEALVRRGLWDAAVKMREDWDLNIRLIAAQEPFLYLESALYWYRKRPDSITTGDPQKLMRYTEWVLRKHHKKYADAGDSAIAKIYAANMWGLGRQHLRQRGDIYAALRCARESFSYDFNLPRLFHAAVHNTFRRLTSIKRRSITESL